MRARSILVWVTSAAAAACSGDGGGSGASPVTATTTSVPPSSVALAEPKLPAIQPVAKVGGATIKASREADWVVVAHDRAWISGLGKGVGVYDARTGRPLGSVAVPEVPCAATDAGFGAVWTATCEPSGVSRIDPATARVTGHVRLSATPEGESSIGVGEGAVWALIDGSDCRRCAVARIDPKTLKVTGRYPVPGGAAAVRAGLGGVWVTNSQTDSVLRLDPSTGKIVATIPVASGPRFFDVGAGAVWVMAQNAGAVCRIDPADNRLVGCTVIDPTGVQGGDLTVGNGFVWFRGTAALVAQVDPKNGRVVRRIGPGEGSGSAAAGSGQLWISAHDVSKLYRVPVQ
jgi:virginiamycin B lyase